MTENAFRNLALAVRPRCISTCLGYGLGEMEADDIAQDVMLKLWTMRQELDHYRSPEALAVVMTRHLVIDQKRKQAPLRIDATAAAATLASASPSPSQAMEQLEDEQWLERRLSQLPSKQHTVLMMRQVERKTYAEIAAIMGISEVGVRSLISRARKTLLDEFRQRQQQ